MFSLKNSNANRTTAGVIAAQQDKECAVDQVEL